MAPPPVALFTDEGNANKNIDDIMTAILPEEDQEEIPVGFTQVGHIGTRFLLYRVSSGTALLILS